MMQIEPEITRYREPDDATREGYIASVWEWMSTHDPDAASWCLIWCGEVITIDAAAARGGHWQ